MQLGEVRVRNESCEVNALKVGFIPAHMLQVLFTRRPTMTSWCGIRRPDLSERPKRCLNVLCSEKNGRLIPQILNPGYTQDKFLRQPMFPAKLVQV